MHLKLTWPRRPDPAHCESLYLGAWSAHGPVTFEWADPPRGINPIVIRTAKWFLMSNRSPFHSPPAGLVHAQQESEEVTQGVAFRGYLLTPPIHSYSPSREILDYWAGGMRSEHNGVFSAVCIRESGNLLELITDALGMAPLYYRRWGDLVLFATHPRYLTADQDQPDYMAWRSLIQSGFIVGDRTLTLSIRRVPAGHVLRFRGDAIEPDRWFDYRKLPEGSRKVDGEAIAQSEEAFQTALSRCLRLPAEERILPLSSGHDSRRILAGLMHRKVPFEAITAQTLQKGNRDLDARFASLMAAELGFPHRLVRSAYPLSSREYAGEYARNDRKRRVLLAAECKYHTWAVPLMDSLPARPTIFFDGLAGDALCESGFEFSGLHVSDEVDRLLIAQNEIGPGFNGILRGGRWPSADEVRQEIIGYMKSLPPGLNQAELAFLLLHTRRAIAPWAQQMLPAGHVVVCPYLDLDHIRITLSYHPAEKYSVFLQRSCLARYWPRISAYPGTRNIPADIPPGPPQLTYRRDLACFRQLQRELKEAGLLSVIQELITSKAALQFWLARKIDRVAVRMTWAFRPLMEIVLEQKGGIPCWQIIPGGTEGELRKQAERQGVGSAKPPSAVSAAHPARVTIDIPQSAAGKTEDGGVWNPSCPVNQEQNEKCSIAE